MKMEAMCTHAPDYTDDHNMQLQLRQNERLKRKERERNEKAGNKNEEQESEKQRKERKDEGRNTGVYHLFSDIMHAR